jgi:glucosylceramidase
LPLPEAKRLFTLVRGVPPAFMKDTKNMLQGGKLLPSIKLWANYYIKFIKSYERKEFYLGLNQNEPMAKQTWESCIYRRGA